MRSPSGTCVTQFELHDLEEMSLIKIDLLSVNALDKIHTTLDLLCDYGYIERKPTLKETYESAIGVYTLERKNKDMWKMIWNHEILSLFQMEKQSGIQGIALTKPESVDDLAVLNSVLRLMAPDKNAEQPLNKFARFKADKRLWYKEMANWGLTEHEMHILEPIVGVSYGIAESQEKFMRLVQLPECGGFDLNFADRLRKSIAKKNPAAYEQITKEYFEETEKRGCSKNLCSYVWNVLVAMSRGYGFNSSHTLAYSIVALQEMNLAFKYPIVFWNTANLIIDSGSNSYDKMATAMGRMIAQGVKISPPDINKSLAQFSPNAEKNQIEYGLSGLIKVNDKLIKKIIEGRPYTSIQDFCARIKPTKPEMISLLKSGAFDCLEPNRKKAMFEYLWSVFDKKSEVNLRNMPFLIKNALIPETMSPQVKIYEFNRYLNGECKYDDTQYRLDERARNFLDNSDFTIDYDDFLDKKSWKKVYENEIDVMRQFIRENIDELKWAINEINFKEIWGKYALPLNISNWEMASMCFYFHEHELKDVNKSKYGIVEFNTLNEEPTVVRTFKKGENQIPIFKLEKIAGTCIAKSKDKGLVYLLTPESGVVTVRLNKEHFALFNKQISEPQPDGTKKIIEKSWFNRGNMLIVQGIRRGDEFVGKKYANSGHQLYHIDEVLENGDLVLRSDRKKGIAEDDVEEV